MKLTIGILMDKLPSGSGINCKWDIMDKGKYFKCLNAFHCMDEHGYYDGWVDFSVIIPKNKPLDFKLHFHGDYAQGKNRKYMLRDYLEDTIYNALYWNAGID